ncbi:Hypothetical_protein [Hexamita inflata]|uniref:Hypothetical_protein n=1 Tax=Hexamita inflata TaxID=28002 RepID=A0AA86PVS7_9EUKA|nr:Hypothetical protein HINF_LOCUS33401 [Hexamita inflata]
MFEYANSDDLIKDYAMKKLNICAYQWKVIEAALKNQFPFISTYQTKTYSEKQFRDVIVANWLLPYPYEVQRAIEIEITKFMNSKTTEIKKLKSEHEISLFLSNTLKYIKEKFNLNGTGIYSYKKQYNKNSYNIMKMLKTIIKGNTIKFQDADYQQAQTPTKKLSNNVSINQDAEIYSRIINPTPGYSPSFEFQQITSNDQILNQTSRDCNYDQEVGLQNLDFYNFDDTPLDSCVTEFPLQNINTDSQTSI